MDGQQQRRALTAATSALRALAAGQAARAVHAAGKAAALDQLGMYAGFAEWVGRAAEEVEEFGRCCRPRATGCGTPWDRARWRRRWRSGWRRGLPCGGGRDAVGVLPLRDRPSGSLSRRAGEGGG